MPLIVVPVKSFADAKQRLAGVLTTAQRRALAEAMLRDVAAAICRVQRKVRIAFVTSDPEAEAIGRSNGFEIITDHADSGETDAVSIATEAAMQSGARSLLVIPGDVPLVTAAELENILDAAPPRGTVLVPAFDGRGTNAILRTPPNLFPARFGNDSFKPHVECARHSGAEHTILRLPGLAVDIDNPADLERLAASDSETAAGRLMRSWRLRATSVVA